jgi:hypothetical protein
MSVVKLAANSIERMKEEMRTRGAVDVFKWFMFTTMDVISDLTFGESFHMIDEGKVRRSTDKSIH